MFTFRRKLIFSSLIIGIILIVLFANVLAFDEKIKWTCSSGWTPSDPHHLVALEWAKRVERLSGGRIEIECYSVGELVPAFEVRQAAAAGSIDCAHAWSGFYMGEDMANLLLASTPAFLDNEGYLTWLVGAGGMDFWQKVVGDELVAFCAGLIPPELGVYTHKELNNLEDFKGLKIRGPLHMVDVFEKFGGSGVFIPPGEIVSSFQRGVIDAAEYSNPTSDVAIGIHEVAEYQYLPGMQQQGHTIELIINKDKWNELSPDLQEIVKVACEAEVFADYPKWYYQDTQNIKVIEEETDVRKLSPEIQNVMVNAYIENCEKYAKESELFAEMWNSMKKFMVDWHRYSGYHSVEWADKESWLQKWENE
ncbi:TRAP transporter substrate-binding protein DctP [Candidatus Bathyarchaeota archaeon]|nr:TRAP transporter substrate-binding protein DctP [Candidatus Bathyarchaeota archaeon]